MQAIAVSRGSRRSRGAGALAIALLAAGSAWDAVAFTGLLPAWWPRMSYLLIGVGIAAGSLAVLLRILARRRVPQRDGAGSYPPLRGTALELLSIGLFLLVWVLRGHAEIPTDPPLIGGQLIALAGVLVAAWRRRTTAGPGA